MGEHKEGVHSVNEKKHVMLYCPNYDAERNKLILNLREIKLQFDFCQLLHRCSGNNLLFPYLRRTNLIQRE